MDMLDEEEENVLVGPDERWGRLKLKGGEGRVTSLVKETMEELRRMGVLFMGSAVFGGYCWVVLAYV